MNIIHFIIQELSQLVDQQPDIVVDGGEESDDELKIKPKHVKYDVESSKLDSSGLYYKDSDSELEMESDSEDETEKDSLGKLLKIMRIYYTNKDGLCILIKNAFLQHSQILTMNRKKRKR